MKEWHIRHQIFHQFFNNSDIGDDLNSEIIIEEYEDNIIIQRALEYPHKQTKELYYPGKSYAIAVTFAKLLEHHFGEDFYTSLNDELLLYGNDPYYKTYSESKHIYDQIIKDFPFEILFSEYQECSANYKKTQEYFLKEFLIHDDTKHLLPS